MTVKLRIYDHYFIQFLTLETALRGNYQVGTGHQSQKSNKRLLLPLNARWLTLGLNPHPHFKDIIKLQDSPKKWRFKKFLNLNSHLEIERVICIRHQATLIGTLQLETMRDPSIGCPIFPITAEICKTFIVSQFLKVFMICLYSTGA